MSVIRCVSLSICSVCCGTATCKIHENRETAMKVFEVVKPTGKVRWKIRDSIYFASRSKSVTLAHVCGCYH